MNQLDELLRAAPRGFLVTGGAGFIGSHLVARLLRLGQRVTVLDDLSTGFQANLDRAVAEAGPGAADRLRFLRGDIADPNACREAVKGAEVVLHQAALGSVPRSMEEPRATHRVNVDGFLEVLLAARDAGVHRFVYASSSSVYGDSETLPKEERDVGRPLSPYALSKQIDEQYAALFHRTWGVATVGLRYFNVFGPRQDPNGPYAAVIPRWIDALLHDRPCLVNGDGSQSRDFCFVENVVAANLLAATRPAAGLAGEVFNIACGERTTLLELHAGLAAEVGRLHAPALTARAQHGPSRAGDIPHSHATIDRARGKLGYAPSHRLLDGLPATVRAFAKAGE